MSTSAAAALAKKRVRRQKQFLAVGSVLLLAILGFELPKMLSHGKTAGLSVTTTTASTTSTGATASPSPLAAAPFTGTLADTDGIPLAPNTSQLVSFGLFKSKDPFVQQLSTVAKTTPSTPPPTPAPAKKPATTKAKTVTTPATATPSVAPAPTVVTTAAPTPAPTVTTPSATPGQVITPTEAPTATTTTPSATTSAPTVFISTNGVCEQVSVNGTFPGDDDVFRVVEVAKNGKWVKIGSVGGSYDSGQATATAKLGEKLTLVNTADGTRYVILLQTKCEPAPPGSAPASRSPVTTPAPPVVSAPVVPPQSSTPPIVTDGYDPTPAPSN
jgi:hypothetical protein